MVIVRVTTNIPEQSMILVPVKHIRRKIAVVADYISKKKPRSKSWVLFF